ncbi:hypothetical protein DMC64_14920 [Amycolatopsis sp. WAC 04197]|uniref:hypothetical protein n=1 Tax=Amycolatopsis sp. WAC 04197 TaxID=2203199 RepID=UPI000F783996|nr:hypothetical protein [Amycolatopsis sp. WAC 04197]RSN46032.1 hypothetical protein DMC64_14920 [Amycolatopsis sp. WAC 04197]
MKIRKSRVERLPRSIEKRLRYLRKREAPEIVTAQLAEDIDRKVAAVGEGADPTTSIENYVMAHKAQWALKIKDEHNRLLTEIGGLAAEADALVEYRRILCEDQRDVLDDLDAAVAHALERVTDPDAPYHEPIRRSERRGGKK